MKYDDWKKIGIYCDSEQFDDLPKVKFVLYRHGSRITGTYFRVMDFDTGVGIIDIFPFTIVDKGTPDVHKKFCELYEQYRIAGLTLFNKGALYSNVGKTKDIEKAHSFTDLYHRDIRKMLSPNDENNFIIGSILNTKRAARLFPAEWWFPVTEIEFEGYKFLAPANADKMLTMMYGNYWSLPPVKKPLHRPPNTLKIEKSIECIKGLDIKFYEKHIEEEWEAYNAGKK